MKYIDFLKITQTIVCTVSFVCCASVQASQLHLQLENDAAFAEDGNYSNGMILGWESHAIKQKSKSDFDLRYWQQLFFSLSHKHTKHGV